jgi:hypothetical protein
MSTPFQELRERAKFLGYRVRRKGDDFFFEDEDGPLGTGHGIDGAHALLDMAEDTQGGAAS